MVCIQENQPKIIPFMSVQPKRFDYFGHTFVTKALIRKDSIAQGLSQNFETGCPKLINIQFLGVFFFQGRQQNFEVTTINMYSLIKIRNNIIIQYNVMGIMLRWKNFNYMLKIDIL